MMETIWLIPLLPLLGFLINGSLARRFHFPEKLVGAIAVGTIALAFLLSVGACWQYAGWSQLPENQHKAYIAETGKFTWLPGGAAQITHGQQAGQALTDLRVEWSYQLDQLSGVYLLFITFVGLLIHIFAIGYMKGEAGFARFFAYLNLFMFMMLVLVLGSNLLMLFVGWEGVGLCSYLLIGFYLTRNEAGDASKKAFVINRIGDLGFVLAIAGIFATFGTLQFSEINRLIASYPVETLGTFGLLSWLALGLFIGATGKSAQIPLFIWLPDAMAGPTPVSALIHAATMVTAGVYLLARMNALFQRSLTMMLVVAIIGLLTAFVAATIAVSENDIKKVLAYSTISQLGYMFLACGVGAFSAAIFHVVTHAFFKAQLFLGAGSVIHALHHEQDLQKMGGLKKYLPTTHWTMAVSWLAICGVIPFAGFWSKDEILASTFTTHLFGNFGGKIFWFIGLITAGLTAFYMTRLMALAFWSRERFLTTTATDGGEAEVGQVANRETHHEHHQQTGPPKESPAIMTVPLMLLAALAAIGGVIGLPKLDFLGHWLTPMIAKVPGVTVTAHEFGVTEIGLAVVSLVVVAIGIYAAYSIYVNNPTTAERLATSLRPLYRLSANRWYWDYLLDVKLVALLKRFTQLLWQGDEMVVDNIPNGSALVTRGVSIVSGSLDRYGVDLVVNLIGWFTRATSVVFRTMQSGFLNNYALVMVLGVCAILIGLEYDAFAEIYRKLAALFSFTKPPVPPTQ